MLEYEVGGVFLGGLCHQHRGNVVPVVMQIMQCITPRLGNVTEKAKPISPRSTAAHTDQTRHGCETQFLLFEPGGVTTN